jgi:hypothetical protein
MLPAWSYAVLILVAGSAVTAAAFLRSRASVDLASDDVRHQWFEYFTHDPKMVWIRDSTVADLLLAEAKYVIGQRLDTIKTLEGKAATQLGIVGSGIGLLSVFGATQSAPALAHPAEILAAAAFLLLSIACNLTCISIGRTDVLPSLDVYNSEELVKSAEMKGRVSTSLTEGYLDLSNDLLRDSRTKGRLQQIATVCFLGGVLVLALNYVLVALHPQVPSANAIHCESSTRGVDCKETTK